MRFFLLGGRVFVAVAQLSILYVDAILLFGFSFFGSPTPISHAGLMVMLLGDATGFGLSWWRPRIGALTVISVSVVSLLLVTLGATKGGIASIWLSVAIYWGTKLLLALILMHTPLI